MAKRKAHSEVRWVMKYTSEAKPYFGQILVRDRNALAHHMQHGKSVKVTVTEILPTPKRKAKR